MAGSERDVGIPPSRGRIQAECVVEHDAVVVGHSQCADEAPAGLSGTSEDNGVSQRGHRTGSQRHGRRALDVSAPGHDQRRVFEHESGAGSDLDVELETRARGTRQGERRRDRDNHERGVGTDDDPRAIVVAGERPRLGGQETGMHGAGPRVQDAGGQSLSAPQPLDDVAARRALDAQERSGARGSGPR